MFGMVKRGRLVFASNVHGLEVTAGPSLPHLYQTSLRHFAPRVWIQEGIVTVEFRRFPLFDQMDDLPKPVAQIRMNGSIPWEVEFHNGVSHLIADLANLQLCSLDILGDGNQIRVTLSRPSGTTYIYILGSISQSAIHVPSTVGIRVQISGGSTKLTFEDQRFETIRGETSLESPNYDSATSRYDICIAGGISDLTIHRDK